jgi:hypothetical protein
MNTKQWELDVGLGFLLLCDTKPNPYLMCNVHANNVQRKLLMINMIMVTLKSLILKFSLKPQR